MSIVIQKLSAFSDGISGGNPAGVVLENSLPDVATMQRIASEVGFSETVFAAPENGGWRVRYFSPESEVPFCGHATIALGAALAERHGNGEFRLKLNDAKITVSGEISGSIIKAALQSPPTQSAPADQSLIAEILDLFGYTQNDLDPFMPCGFAQAGATHIIIALKARKKLAQMTYDLDKGRALMNAHNLTTIAFIFSETSQKFHVRNAFASGGVIEDPATGAAAAALAGYLRDIDWPHNGALTIIQGEDMGLRSIIEVKIPPVLGSSIKVSGTARPYI
ncbi:MAG: PhzF family phenazine biosynthesis protein [Robiginitomaculum sp.]|nr:PhzF family phenazine biosynthesis protein [Robiginitomaculum sp.]